MAGPVTMFRKDKGRREAQPNAFRKTKKGTCAWADQEASHICKGRADCKFKKKDDGQDCRILCIRNISKKEPEKLIVDGDTTVT